MRQLRHFAALAENGSFVAAADVVGLSQPAFSRSIQALEHSLDCQLVDRSSRELRLTAQGLLVLEHAQRLLLGAHKLRNELVQFNGLSAGELRFGCGPTPAQALIPEALADFVRAYPGIQIDWEINHWDALSKRLLEEQLEFFVADARDFLGDPLYQVQVLSPSIGCFFCNSGHPLLARASLTLSDVMQFPLVAPRLSPSSRRAMARVSGRGDFRATVECGQFDAILRIVERSQAIGVATRQALQAPNERGALVELRLDDLPELRFSYGIIRRAGKLVSPAAQAMIAAIVEADQRQGASASGASQ
ncbi:LysR family transcriptional regulator [Zestomonas insulae]|uniref:LysR family transcriptional regulator n=1 Tax=Zestomonas insulae TaxID=2809017 RepID=UPI001EF62F27|nr:LysR family transcriptional regulator [Pseudomonas insulae]